MKRLVWIYFFIGTVFFLLSSCMKRDDVVESLSVLSARTKVSLDTDLCAVWNKSDAVSVFYGSDINERWTYSGASGSPSGVLQHRSKLREVPERIVALYPYNTHNVMSEGNIHTTLLPVQRLYSGSFDSKAALMTAVSSDRRSLEFSFAVSFIALELTGAGNYDIDRLVLRASGGEPLAGNLSIDISSYVCRSSVVSDQKYEVELKTDAYESLTLSDKPLLCIFAVVPGMYTKGFEIDIISGNGKVMKVKDTFGYDLRPGYMHRIRYRMVESEGDYVIKLPFIDTSGNGYSPFNEVSAEKGKALNITGKRLTMSEYPYLFEMNVQRARLIYGNNNGLELSVSPDDFIKVPAVSGYRLMSVTLTSDSNTKIDAEIKEYGSDVAVPGDIISDEIVFEVRLTGTLPGVAYNLVFASSASYSCIKEIVYSYEIKR